MEKTIIGRRTKSTTLIFIVIFIIIKLYGTLSTLRFLSPLRALYTNIHQNKNSLKASLRKLAHITCQLSLLGIDINKTKLTLNISAIFS